MAEALGAHTGWQCRNYEGLGYVFGRVPVVRISVFRRLFWGRSYDLGFK